MADYGRSGWKAARHRWDDALARMDPLAFERLVADYFRREGYRVEHIGTGGSARRYDGGIDLKLYRGEEIIVVQCKRWTAAQVTHNPMHELVGVMHTSKATGAILVTSGEFSSYALRKAAEVPGLRMIDGVELRRLLGSTLPATPVSPASAYSLSAPVTRSPEGQVTYRPKPGPESALKDLMALVITVGLFLVMLRMCSASNADTTRPTLRAQPREAKIAPAPAPPIQSMPSEIAPQPQAPTPPAIEKRYYQTPDEAMKVLEPNTPEV